MTQTTPANSGQDTSTQTKGTTEAGRPSGKRVGDLARRVTLRRIELGLSTEQVAKRAGMDPWFLAYFEQSADTSLDGGGLRRLAIALDTTPVALEGGEVDRPPGRGRAGPYPTLQSLTPEQCVKRIVAGGIGRIILSTGSGPVALPVNFVFSKGAVLFRTSDAMTATVPGIVAFEVDHIDEAMSAGWSVLLRGHARLIEDAGEWLAAGRLDIEPWAGGNRPNLVSIAPFEMTGRVIVQHQSPQGVAPGEQHQPSDLTSKERRAP